MANFMSALDKPMDEIERPKPVPTGTYVGQIVGLPVAKEVTTKDGDKETMDVQIKIVSSMQIDNPDALSEYGDISTARPLRRTFWFSKPATPDELWAFKQFCTNVLKIETAGKTMKQVAAEMQGKQLVITVTQNTYTDKSGDPVVGNNISGTAAL